MQFPKTKLKESLAKDSACFDTRFTDSEHPMLIVRDDSIGAIDYNTTSITTKVFIVRSHGIWDIILPKRDARKREWWFNDVKNNDALVIGENQYEIVGHHYGPPEEDNYEWYIE